MIQFQPFCWSAHCWRTHEQLVWPCPCCWWSSACCYAAQLTVRWPLWIPWGLGQLPGCRRQVDLCWEPGGQMAESCPPVLCHLHYRCWSRQLIESENEGWPMKRETLLHYWVETEALSQVREFALVAQLTASYELNSGSVNYMLVHWYYFCYGFADNFNYIIEAVH